MAKLVSDWNLKLTGGPRGGEIHTHPTLPPFLKFTTWDTDGTTRDYFYGPLTVNQPTMTATYAPIETPESVLAIVWDQGYAAGYPAGCNGDVVANPYRKAGE